MPVISELWEKVKFSKEEGMLIIPDKEGFKPTWELIGVHVLHKNDGGNTIGYLKNGKLTKAEFDKLCKIIDCSAYALQNYTAERFMKFPNGEPLSWNGVLNKAYYAGELHHDSPGLGGRAEIGGKSFNSPPKDLRRFKAGDFIKSEIPTRLENTSLIGWSILAFWKYADNKFSNLLPRFEHDRLFWGHANRLPDQETLRLPQKEEHFNVDDNDVGECEMIYVLHKDEFERDLVDKIKATDDPSELLDILSRLSEFLGRINPDDYLVIRQPCIVEAQ